MFGDKRKPIDEEKLMTKLAEELGGYPSREYEAYVPRTKTSNTPIDLTVVMSHKRALMMLRWAITKGWISEDETTQIPPG